MEDVLFNGKYLWRYLHFQALAFLLSLLHLGFLLDQFNIELLGRTLLFLVAFLILLRISFSKSCLIKNNEIEIINPITRSKEIVSWNEIKEMQEIIYYNTDQINKIVIRFLMYWIFSFLIESKYRVLNIRKKDETEIRIYEYRISEYDKLKKMIETNSSIKTKEDF
jgi:hypothetical protein